MSTASRPGARLIAAVAVALAAMAIVVLDLHRILLRMGFDYDLLLWADDYFMTSMLKLAAGVPVYTAVSEANSTVYAPGGPYLHHALLSPIGLGDSLLANRVLSQLWLAIAVGLGTAVVIRIARSSDLYPEERNARRVFWVLTTSVLAVVAYANPVADALHPTNLELCTLTGAQLALAGWPQTTRGRRIALALALPVLAVLAKQTAGLAVASAVAWVGLRQTASAPARGTALALPFASLGVALAVLTWWTDGHFWVWGFEILARHPFDWWKVTDIYRGYFLLFGPAVVWFAIVGASVLRRPSDEHASFRGAAAVAVFYVPFALAALFKTMGGPNNLAVVGYLATVLALPSMLGALLRSRSVPLSVVAFAVVALQVGLLYPRRRVPDARDFQSARTMCDYASARLRCGDEVFLGRGAMCHLRGGRSVPIDRMNSITEVRVAGRQVELGFYQRVVDQRYDVMIFSLGDMMWFGDHLWQLMRTRYKAFHMTKGELDGDFWFHGWQGYSTLPVVFWERLGEEGTHSVDEVGMKCPPRG